MKKIMFNDKYGLTQAVLDNRKTMTRRIVPKHILNEVEKYQDEYYNGALETISEKDAILAICTYEHRFKLPYQVGEVVAIAQCYRDIEDEDYRRFLENCRARGIKNSAGARNKMFVKARYMPHHILITNVRIERLQEISNEDCLREGISKAFNGTYNFIFNKGNKKTVMLYDSPKEAFMSLIDKVSGKGTWDSNPWVFVYEFKHIY